MDSQNAPLDDSVEIPEDATVIKQVRYAWVWSSTPWLIAVAALLFSQIIPIDEVTASVLTFIIIVPRYFNWRRTAYILTPDKLIYQRGGILKTSRYPIPISNLRGAKARYGRFGRALGYQAVDITMANGSVASLTYLSPLSGVAEHLQEMIDASEPESPEGGDAEELSDEPSSPGQDGSPDDKASTD